jgi:PEP-CTERM motif-containing protein
MVTKFKSNRTGIDALKFNIAALVPRLFFLVVSVIGSQVLTPATASSTTLPPIDISVGARAVDFSQSPIVDDKEPGVTDAFGGAASAPGADSGITAGHGQANVSLGPTPVVSASGAGANSATPNPATGAVSINAGGSAGLIYYFTVSGAAGALNSVQVKVDVVLSTSIAGPVNGASASAGMSITDASPFPITSDGTNINIARTNGGSFSGTIALLLTPGNIYQVDLTAAATGFGAGGSASAFADPHIYIDSPALAALYSIVVSDGVGNDPLPGFGGTPVVTPLPATLPLFATGLGALGLLCWRRKRKAVVER